MGFPAQRKDRFMGRFLKLISVVVGAIVVLIVAAGLVLTLFIDPNDYKDQITQAVSDATGRELVLEGDLELRLFPSLRISVGRARLSNAAGFGDEPFAELDGASLQLELMPLLSRRISVDEASLRGLRLNLARSANGTNNWQDLGGSGAGSAASSQPAEAGGATVALEVAAIQVDDAQVTWSDASTGSRWVLDNFNLNASDFGSDVAFPLAMQFALSGEQVEVVVDSRMRATLSLNENSYRLDDLEVELSGEGAGWPGGSGMANLRFDSFTANLDAETVDLDNLNLRFLGLDVTGSLSGRNLLSNLSLSGAIDIAAFDPHDVLDVFDLEIETADDSVFSNASARAELVYDSTQLSMREMTLSLDDSTLTGSMGLRGEALRFNLAVDDINIDRYLPPAEDPAAGAEPDEGSLDEVDLPLDVFRTLNASGELRLGRTQFTGLRLSDAVFTVAAGNGRVRLTPRAALYGGTIAGEIGIDVQGDTANFSLEQRLQGVNMLDLGRDYLATEAITGTGNVSLDLEAVGANMGEVMRALDGAVSFEVTDGSWEGLDAWYELRRARAVASGNDAPAREGARRTPFSRVSATGAIEDAVLTNRDLNATLGFMSIDGAGTVNLLTDAIDFEVTATFIDGQLLQSDPEMASLAGASLPLNVGGTLAAPAIRPDFGALVRARARQEVQERVDEERSEVQERVDQEREEVQERVRDRLRGILDR
jgi:AsmA protein